MTTPLLAPSTEMVTVTFDGVPVTVPKGTLLVEAAKLVKQQIPIYCYHTKLGPAGLCRICMVEIEGMPKLQIACNTTATDGMVVRTRGEKVDAARALVLELFLVNHPLDCPICDKGGECDLQDYSMAYARGSSDVADPKLSKPKAVDLGPTIVLDEERCIVCQRCVRFDDVIADEQQLVVKDRGAHDIIATATGHPYRHNFTGNVTELCPVGALTSKTYRFKSRPWDLNRTQTTCTQCAVGCQQFADVRHGTLLRTMSVEDDDAISDGWLCDRGRYNIGFYESPDRLTQPLYRRDGGFVQIGWDDAYILWAKAIREAIAARGPASVGAIGGGRLTNEEAFVLQDVFRNAGARNLDWRAGRQRQATPGKDGASLDEIDRAKVVVIAGQSPRELAPVLWLRVRKAALRGAKIVQAASARAAREAAGDAAPVALIWDGADLAEGRGYAEAFAGVSDLAIYIAGEQGNARGAEAMGMLPLSGPGYASVEPGLDGYAMLDAARAGNLAVLSIFGANPARSAIDPVSAARALEQVPFLAVSELFMTETAQRATLVLPAKGAFEKSGTTLALGGDLLPVNASLAAPESVRSDHEMLIGLADQLGVPVLPPEELHRLIVGHVAKAAPDFTLGDERFESRVALRPARGDTAPILSGGGTWEHDPTLAALRS
ncbi:MAG TPA: molybdopterin-dependent oxidoreductase [Candidatus Cybelea sp.]|jgi:NADH-quinone oxidoreductase subunit G|nr:molybdopterin-dependent oxidoreductase [Candidatus Cybelea sp.]